MKKSPKLRFKEFSGEWEEKKFKDIVKINQGLQIAISERYTENGIGRYFYITNEFLRKDSGIKYFIENPPTSVICNEDDILMTRTGNTGKVVTGVSGAFHNNFFKISYDRSNINKMYLYYVLTSYKIQKSILRLAGTSTIPDLNHGDFYNIKVYIPKIEEQQKIASLIFLVDKKIEKQQEKVEALEEYKKGIMQKIFSQEIRFKDENDEEYPKWKHVKLSEVVERVIRRNKESISKLPLTISAQYGLVDQEIFFNKTVASLNLEKYFLLYKGEFAYNKSYSAGYPWGAIKRLDNYDMGVLSSLYICFSPLEVVNSDFLVHYFETNCWHKEISMIAVEGARNHGLLNISVSDFFETLHYIPSYEEQVKIADFLTKLEKKFNKEKEKLGQLKEWKKGLLQQMFV